MVSPRWIPMVCVVAVGCVSRVGGGGGEGETADASQARSGCTDADSDTVFYFGFGVPAQDGRLDDLTGSHSALSSSGSAVLVSGPSAECGDALDLSTAASIAIKDDEAFMLSIASLDLYVLVPERGDELGIASRDARGAVSGHFDMVFNAEGQVVVRLQKPDSSAVFRCSSVQPTGEWIRIGVNIGPPNLELFVDGTLAQEPAATYLNGDRECGEESVLGLGTHDNPWTIGASQRDSLAGTGRPATVQLGTAIDEVRLSRARRVY